MLQHVGRLARTTTVYGLGQVLLRFISLLLLPLFTSYLTPTEYGISAMLGLITFVLTPIFSLGLGTAIGICFFESEDRQSRSTVIWTSFAILMVSAAILLAGTAPFASQISELVFKTPEYAFFVQLNVVTMCLGILVNPFMYFLQFEERAISYVVITIVVGLASIGLSIIFVVHLREGLKGVLVATVIGQTLGFLLFFGRSVVLLSWGVSAAIGTRLLKLGAPLIPSFIFLFVITQGNKYLLQNEHGLDALGIYNIGFNIGSVMNLLVGAFTTAWTPFFLSFSSRQEEGRELFGRLTGYYTVGFGLVSLAFYAAARTMVLVLTAAPYHGAFVVIGPTATAQYLTGVFSMLLPAMYFAQDVKFVVVVQAAATVVTVIVGFVAISTLGVLGAAITPAAGMFAMVIAQIVWNYSRRERYLRVAYPWKQMAVFAACYFAIATVLLWDRDLPVVQEFAYSMVLSVIALAIAIALVPRADINAAWSYAKSRMHRSNVNTPVPK